MEMLRLRRGNIGSLRYEAGIDRAWRKEAAATIGGVAETPPPTPG
jgi:hypothetical protein